MKYVIGLCALLAAGHAVAAGGSCTAASLKGSYIANAAGQIGTSTGFIPFSEAASAIVFGNGYAKAQISYSIGGSPTVHAVQVATYTVSDADDDSGNCKADFTAVLGGQPVSFVGYFGPSGDEMFTQSVSGGTTFSGVLKRSQPRKKPHGAGAAAEPAE